MDRFKDFEKFVKAKGLRPCGKMVTEKGDIYIAETYLERDKPFEFPNGYYQTFYCLVATASKGKLDGGSWLMFDADHDNLRGWSQRQRQDARIEATMQEAVNFLNSSVEVGRYH